MHSHVITLEHNTTVNLSQQGQKNVYVPIKKNDKIKSHRKNISSFTKLN